VFACCLDLVYPGQHLFPRDLAGVGGLNLSANADELLLQGVLGRCVQHLGLDLGGLRAPNNKNDLVPPPTVLLVLEVEDAIPAVILGQIVFEILPRGRVRGGLFQNDVSQIGRHLEEEVAVLVSELKFVELVHAFIVDGNSGHCRGVCMASSTSTRVFATAEFCLVFSPVVPFFFDLGFYCLYLYSQFLTPDFFSTKP